MQPQARYRRDSGVLCIDVRLRNARQLFDYRDPAPFRERDLDKDAVEYLVAAVQELPRKASFKIVFWIAEPLAPPFDAALIGDSVRAYFEYERDKLERNIRLLLRRGQQLFWLGLTILVLCLLCAELFVGHQDTFSRVATQGLVITGWVAMWRPIEALLYDWWPLVRARRSAVRLLCAPVEVLATHGDVNVLPEGPTGDKALSVRVG